MIAIRCDGKNGTCQNLLGYFTEDNIFEFKMSKGEFGVMWKFHNGVGNCWRCGKLHSIDGMKAIFENEIKKRSLVATKYAKPI